MKIGIQPDKTSNESYSDKWKEFLNERRVQPVILDLLAGDVQEQINNCDGVMWRWLHKPQHHISAKVILKSIEDSGIPTFPNQKTCWHFDNKIAQYYLLKSIDAPLIDTYIFWNYDNAIEWLEAQKYPLIAKLKSGAGSSNVLLLKDSKEAKSITNLLFYRGLFPYNFHEYKKTEIGLRKRVWDSVSYALFSRYPSLPKSWWVPEKGYAYFQKFLPDNTNDIRVTIIGNRAFAYRRFNRPNDFRASGSGNFDVNPKEIDLNAVIKSFEISIKCQFQSMAYDFIYDQNKELKLCEISYTFVDWMVHECPGHWDENLNWIEGQMWPEDAQVADFINEIKKTQK